MAIDLGGITIEHLTQVDVRERIRIVQHGVPGLSGNLAQAIGRPSVEVQFEGIFYGPDATEELTALRAAYLAQEPVDFFTEAVGEGYFAQVVIIKLLVSQRAGYLDQFSFSCEVSEYVEPPEPLVSDPLAALEADIQGQAIDFVDGVQNALAEVSSLVDLLPSFGDPTQPLRGILGPFVEVTGSGSSALTDLADLF